MQMLNVPYTKSGGNSEIITGYQIKQTEGSIPKYLLYE
jgi:hypothetical protein